VVRHTVWTPETRELLVSSIAEGERPIAACRKAGVSQNTYYRWLRHGRAALAKQATGHALAPSELAFAAFVVAIMQAS
jgi:transposase-like protein